jgi:phospholipid transport system transporter-binding protein
MDGQEPSNNTDAAATVIDCSGMQDIAGAATLYQRLSDALVTGNPVVLDASHTERLDAAAAQLLYAFMRNAQAQGVTVSWQQPSDAVGNAAQLLGMQAGLGLTNH